jgi:hypothetical protein
LEDEEKIINLPLPEAFQTALYANKKNIFLHFYRIKSI